MGIFIIIKRMNKEQLKIPKYKTNKNTKKNNYLFAIIMIILQFSISTIYGICGNSQMNVVNIHSIITSIFIAILVIIGFGLQLSFIKQLKWSGIGFSLMITAICIEFYPLINAFFSKLSVFNNPLFKDSFENTNISIVLAKRDSYYLQGNTIVESMKCSLAICISLRSIIGRISTFQCLILSVLGVFGYQINRCVIMNIGQDVFGTFSIFTFGGFMGLTIGCILAVKEKKNGIVTINNKLLVGDTQSALVSLIGAAFIFILFPFLAFQGDNSSLQSLFHPTITPVSIMLSMASSIISSLFLSEMVQWRKRAKIRVINISNSIMAGGIIAGACSFYITLPIFAIIIGSCSGISQYFFDYFLQRKIHNKIGVISTYSFSLACLQSFLGSILAFFYNWNSKLNKSQQFIFSNNQENKQSQIKIYFISMGFGVAFGLIIGIVCYILCSFNQCEMFIDKPNFVTSDYISVQMNSMRLREQRQPQSAQPLKRQTDIDQQINVINIESTQRESDNFEKNTDGEPILQFDQLQMLSQKYQL